MQNLRKCIWNLLSNYKSSANKLSNWKSVIPVSSFHTSSSLQYEDGNDRYYADLENKQGSKWMQQNEVVFPPLEPGEKPRHAFVCNMKKNIKYSPKKMWYIACLVRGLTVDEAIKQLSFCSKKGAVAAKETIIEAQEMAVEKHNVEFKSNLWVSESFVGKGVTHKGLRRHAKGRVGKIHYRHVHYFVRLEEGIPPKHYYLPHPKTKEDLIQEFLVKMRARKARNAL